MKDLTTLRRLLEVDLLCRDIVRYFIDHTEAADTASGIAEWWIAQDVAPTARALTKLRELGVVHAHLVQETNAVYTLTKNLRVRERLRQYVSGLSSTLPLEQS